MCVCVCVCVYTDSPSGNGAFCEPVELPLLRRLLSLLTDKLDFNFLCILCDTGVDSCLLGCSVVVFAALGAELVPGPGPGPPLLPPQEHTCVALLLPPSVPLLSMGVSAPSPGRQIWSFPTLLFNWDPDWGWTGRRQAESKIKPTSLENSLRLTCYKLEHDSQQIFPPFSHLIISITPEITLQPTTTEETQKEREVLSVTISLL